MPIYGDGKQIRDWLYVDDHNRGIDLIIRKGQVDNTYNIGGNNEWTNIDIVTLICELMDHHKPEGASHSKLITHNQGRAGHDRRYAIDATKITSELGYRPVETFESGIRKTIQWYLENEHWWRRIMNGSYSEWLETNYPSQ